LTPLLDALYKTLEGNSFGEYLVQTLQAHLSTLMTLLFNVGIIPAAVTVMTSLDDHKTLA
jgi:hypothetical protein